MRRIPSLLAPALMLRPLIVALLFLYALHFPCKDAHASRSDGSFRQGKTCFSYD